MWIMSVRPNIVRRFPTSAVSTASAISWLSRSIVAVPSGPFSSLGEPEVESKSTSINFPLRTLWTIVATTNV